MSFINYQHSTATNAQILPGSNLAGSDGVTNSSSQDNIQMIALNVDPVWPTPTNIIPTM